MGQLTVTGLDEAVLAQSSRPAKAHGRSLDQEAYTSRARADAH